MPGIDSKLRKELRNRNMKDINREKTFHNNLVKDNFRNRSLLNKLNRSFYDKNIIWGEVWVNVGHLLRGKRVLDFGSGRGDFSIELAKSGAFVSGIDISDELISIARKRAVDNDVEIEFRVQDGHKTAFPENHFDYIFGNGILHHMDFDAALQEIQRILKKGGKAYFMEPLDSHPGVMMIRKLTPAARSDDEHPLKYNELKRVELYFSECKHKEYFLMSVAIAPINLISYSMAKWMTRMFNRIDQILFRVIPYVRRFAWITLLEMKK